MADSWSKKVKKVLSTNGFTFLRHGSRKGHDVWSNGLINVSIPYDTPSKFTANAILRQAKIDYKF